MECNKQEGLKKFKVFFIRHFRRNISPRRNYPSLQFIKRDIEKFAKKHEGIFK